MTTEEAPVEVPKAEAAAPAATDAAVDDVAERLRFFFSDANIRQDYFIRKLLLNDEGEYSHQVLVESLLRFNTIKQHTTDEAVVIQAAKKLSDKLVVSDDNKAIGRVKPFTLELMDDNIPLTLYVNNLPMSEDGDKKKYSCGADDIRKLFEQYGRVVLLKLRFKKAESSDHDDDDLEPQQSNGARRPAPKRRHPLGAALVEFEDAETLEKAVADVITSKAEETVEPKRKLMIGETQLEVCMLKDYIDTRKKLNPKEPKEGASKDASGDAPKADARGSKKRELEEALEGVEFKMDWKPGCVIRVRGLPVECDREAILEGVGKAMDITIDEVKEKKIYVDYSRGQTDGAIRFPEPTDDVKNLCDKLKEGTVEIAAVKVETAFMLEGEDETKYWTEFIDFKTKQMRHRIEEKASRNNKGGRGGRGGGRGGRGGGRGNYGHSNKRQRNDNW
jgi:hypothetical protein